MAKVYCYCESSDLSLLRGRLMLHDVASLGDPFLLGARTGKPDNQREVTDEEIRHELKKQYSQLPTSLAALGDFDFFYQKAMANRKQVALKILEGERKNPIVLEEKQQTQVCLARFYGVNNNLLLWQSLAAGHSGMVVELNTNNRFFMDKAFQGQPQLFLPVQYRDVRPFVGETDQFLAPLFYQSSQFREEQEWRLVRPKTEPSNQSTIEVKFPVTTINSVIQL